MQQKSPFHCCISTILQRLVIIKMLRGRSSLASLPITLKNDIIAILYKILDIAVVASVVSILLQFCRNLTLLHTLRTSLRLIISKIL